MSTTIVISPNLTISSTLPVPILYIYYIHRFGLPVVHCHSVFFLLFCLYHPSSKNHRNSLPCTVFWNPAKLLKFRYTLLLITLEVRNVLIKSTLYKLLLLSKRSTGFFEDMSYRYNFWFLSVHSHASNQILYCRSLSKTPLDNCTCSVIQKPLCYLIICIRAKKFP